MKIGVCSANSGPYATRDTLVELAERAETAGIESIWVSEHLVLADPREPPSPMDPQDPILDPLATLSFLAPLTTTMLGTGIVVLPLRNPLILAKELATLDVLSGGRLIFGIGVATSSRSSPRSAFHSPAAARARRSTSPRSVRSGPRRIRPSSAGAFRSQVCRPIPIRSGRQGPRS